LRGVPGARQGERAANIITSHKRILLESPRGVKGGDIKLLKHKIEQQ
jgi:hypothetical protein